MIRSGRPCCLDPAPDDGIRHRQVDATLSRKEAGGKQRRRSKRRRMALRVTVIVLCVVVVLAGGAIGYGYFLYSKIHRIHVRGLTVSASTGANAGTENILLVGSTDRSALKVQYTAYGLCSQGVNGVNSDVVMILHLNSATHAVSILSIPRDLFIPNARKEGANKIDAALYEGPQQVVAAVQQDFGIPIQDYVELNFNTFANVVNALGGVDMYFPEPVYDSYSDLDQRTTGCVHLDGYHAAPGGTGPPSPVQGTPGSPPPIPPTGPRRPRATWPGSAATTSSSGSWPRRSRRTGSTTRSPTHRWSTGSLRSCRPRCRSPTMVNLVLNFHAVNPDDRAAVHASRSRWATSATTTTRAGLRGHRVPRRGPGSAGHRPVPRSQAHGEHHDGDPAAAPEHGDRVRPQRQRCLQPGRHTPRSHSMRCGFQIAGVADAPSVGTHAETVVSYNALTPAVEAAAQAVARSLSGAVIMAYEPSTTTSSTTSLRPRARRRSPSRPAPSSRSTPLLRLRRRRPPLPGRA